ncbi:SDR family NAD(P)-dependent oxidoreductase [Rhodococcus opacus]|uniref:SDR family NAD(P)-dependent oxidoreductase n=1 Tax=Rhodococcus opacus TaxID=37919 RepID=A0AAX3Y751_RHOOP|nr:SDR family NAD(P)-dependent oxidoreductase [Rhodococcus opacus]MCZ4590005.1 SDR family NAD(P)-dependent oxidoreductase [Rhodococcus opacus]WLF44530.1 SDR family NAD(P)-dependent oxidoreductase [Rhodococcus opacus]
MSGRLKGQRTLVIGGGSGIGRAVTLAYLREGASVTVVERSAENAQALGEVEGLEVIVGDATDRSVIERAVGRAVSDDGKLDHLTCCVGVFDHYASLRELSGERLTAAADEMWRVNVLSTFTAVNVAWPALRKGQGSITLTLSESAFHPVGGGVLYGSSKWALRGAVHHLAADFAPDVRVNGVAPGGTSGTNFSGLRTLAQDGDSVAAVQGRDERIARGTLLLLTPAPEDHAAAYVYLADRVDARVVTGVVINTDGGRSFD